ncbi:MAG: RNA 3'-terminal phosphate cyclase [Candidatus Heimdallarchaeota archaeon]|nr:RNA 3'-terminal phosphate cyclase [Candidatus Heimdallarchaeota archaeon]MDH5647501.1 RNA 3'-terminal phosphate cyclase [Candidatus Heimdallarchaeota archaeon]
MQGWKCVTIESLNDPILLDGKMGGGSVIRVGVPLALSQKRPIKIVNVRINRPRVGLQVQHIAGLSMLSKLTGCRLNGVEIGSTDIIVEPNRSVYTNSLPKIQIPSSAAVSLVVQTLTNFVIASKNPMGFEFSGGGSHVNFSPNFDILINVNIPLFKLFGLNLSVQLLKPGFYPKGASLGKIYAKQLEHKLVNIEKGDQQELQLISVASTQSQLTKVAEKQIDGFKSIIPDVTNQFAGYANSVSNGSSLSAIIKSNNGSIKGIARIGDDRINPFELGRRTAKATLRELNQLGGVDEQIADQLLVSLAFAPKGSSYTFENIFPHVKTNYNVISQILGQVLEITKEDGYYKVSKI